MTSGWAGPLAIEGAAAEHTPSSAAASRDEGKDALGCSEIGRTDVIYCSGLRTYLEESLWPAGRLGVVSLFTASHQDRHDRVGFFPANHGWATWGSLCFVFPNAAARACLRHPRIINHRQRGVHELRQYPALPVPGPGQDQQRL